MPYPADPGGVFDSDAHRRVLAHLYGETQTVDDLYRRISADVHTPVEEGDLEDVLKDLEADGHASESKAGWKLTKAGLTALGAPVPDEEG